MMVTASYVQEGNSIDYTPTSAVATGDVVVLGDLVGVARTPIAANTLGSLAVRGIFDFPKATGTGSGIAIGTKVYWDATDKQAKADDETGANKLIGKTVKAAADADATVHVRLVQ
jgi:predicted RecA/RadA family phage recombinase